MGGFFKIKFESQLIGRVDRLSYLEIIPFFTPFYVQQDDNNKIAIHCPQGSGTLRQQLLMMDGIAI